MRQILAQGVLTYRQELESLLVLVAIALILGPIAVLVAGLGIVVALLAIPIVLTLYFTTYAACVQAAGFMLRNQGPDPVRAYWYVLAHFRDIFRTTAPGVLLLAVILGSALLISDLGAPFVGLMVGLLGAAAFFLWAARHAYDQPLILVHGVAVTETARTAARLARGGQAWTLVLLAALSLPLLGVGLLSLGLAAAVTPPFGAIVFAVAVALWLPLPAFSLTAACTRLVGAN